MAFVKCPGRPIELSGVRYVMPPLSLGQMEQLDETQLGYLLEMGQFSKERITLYIDLIHASLQRNYPALTREEVATGLDMGNMLAILSDLMERSGLTKDEDAEVSSGEASAVIAGPSGSTSSPSSAATPDGPSSTSAST